MYSYSYYIVLIETLWNVKCYSNTINRGTEIVLIETLWNVKIGNKGWLVWSNVVLIETLWNVKIERMKNLETGEERINRNIVECKDRDHRC